VTPPPSLGLGDARHVLAVEPGADLPVVEVSTWQVPPAFLEECRSLAAALLAERTARHASVVAVSSASPAAGVTTVARCLARFVAESGGERVLLIAPGRGTTAQPGLTALADGAADVAHAVQRTGHERLFLLSAGPHARAISAERAGRAVADLRALFDCVIVDCPPVLSPEFPETVARSCDGAVLVLEPYRESVERLNKALIILRASTRVLGVVFNRSAG
jgi:Mrp family chromosome partitioning ATPase